MTYWHKGPCEVTCISPNQTTNFKTALTYLLRLLVSAGTHFPKAVSIWGFHTGLECGRSCFLLDGFRLVHRLDMPPTPGMQLANWAVALPRGTWPGARTRAHAHARALNACARRILRELHGARELASAALRCADAYLTTPTFSWLVHTLSSLN